MIEVGIALAALALLVLAVWGAMGCWTEVHTEDISCPCGRKSLRRVIVLDESDRIFLADHAQNACPICRFAVPPDEPQATARGSSVCHCSVSSASSSPGAFDVRA